MKIKIAVCIPAFSSAGNIKKCIDSVIKSNADTYDLTILLYNNSAKQEVLIKPALLWSYDQIQCF